MFTRLPINTLSGGVGRQAPTKRLVSEAENVDNCLVTLEKSIEKRPPLVQVDYTKDGTSLGSYLPVPYVDPPNTFLNGGAQTNFNEDNLYFHYLDIDGFNRYCIVINRAAYTFDPVAAKAFTYTPPGGSAITINLSTFLTVFRIEPTEWIQEDVDLTSGYVGNTSGFNRGIFEYLTFGNRDVSTSYRIANQTYTIAPTSIKNTFGSMDYDVGCILWNKLIPVDYLPDNSALEIVAANVWVSTQADNEYIHSGDAINYKISDPSNELNPFYEDVIDNALYWKNVRDDIEFYVNTATMEEEEVGQNVNDFSIIPQYPATEVQSDVQDANGYKAQRMLNHYYDGPRLIPIPAGSIEFTKDHYHQSSPLDPTDRDGNTNYAGFGKIYYARNPYLTFPDSFYRATRYGRNPYFERVRTEEANSVMDHRRFPIIIYKDTATDGKWRVRHLPLVARRSGTSLSNPGPKALERKERIQSMAFWKNRLWMATDNAIIGSRTNSFFNFWIDDVQNIVETDPIDIQSTIGGYNKLSYIVPFQTVMFVASSGSVQFELRGGSIDTGISPFNVELRPTSFFSTARIVEPQKMGNNIFYLEGSRMYMYLGGSAFSDEYSSSMDVSTHCKGYLPLNVNTITTNSSVNSILFVDEDTQNNLYFFTFRLNGDKVIQNAFYRWILSPMDSIKSIKAYEKDLYVVSKRNNGTVGSNSLTVFFASLESVPVSTPMLDWYVEIPTSSMTYSSANNTTTFVLPHYDPEIDYMILTPDWGTEAFSAFEISEESINTINIGGQIRTQFIMTGDYTAHSVYVGHSYLMNVELSQQVQRSQDDQSTVYEGVLNIKRVTFKHFNSGAYDILVERRGRSSNPVTFYPTDINSLLSRNDELKIDRVGEHFVKVLSYSEECKIFIQSDYPTPCNISNIEFLGNFRRFNTSIE